MTADPLLGATCPSSARKLRACRSHPSLSCLAANAGGGPRRPGSTPPMDLPPETLRPPQASGRYRSPMKTVVRSRNNSPGAGCCPAGEHTLPSPNGISTPALSPWPGRKPVLTVAAAEALGPSEPAGQPVTDAKAPAALATTKMEPPGKPPARRLGARLLVGQHDPDDRGKIGLGSIMLAQEPRGRLVGSWVHRRRGLGTCPTLGRVADLSHHLRPTDKLALLPPDAA